MTERQKVIRNLIILILLFLVIGSLSSGSFTPLSAHRKSEKSRNYGPSTIVKSQKFKGGMLYLCKYDKWYTLEVVRREFLWLWHPRDIGCRENNITNPIDFDFGYTSTTGNNNMGRFYGIVNDPNIKSARLDIKMDGQIKTIEQKELYDNMFLFIWDNTTSFESIKFTGFASNSNIIYEKTVPD